MACSRGRSSPIDGLDGNILLHVLANIVDNLDRRSWRLVCRSFFQIECSARRRVQLLRSELLAQVLERYDRLEELDLSCCAGVTDESLFLVADRAGKILRAINLSRVHGFSADGLCYLTRHCSSLVEIDLSYCSYVGDEGLVDLGRANGVEKLKLTGCIRVTDGGLEYLAMGCHKLKVLVLKGCVSITDTGIQLVAAGCKDLTIFDLAFTEITDEGVKYVSKLKELTTLNLMACNNIGDRAITHLQQHCKSLLHLDISRCQNVGAIAMAASSSLRTLHLCHCSQITEEAFVDFQAPNNIQTLKLDGCEITGDILDYIAAGCRQLKELSLSKCRGVTNRRMDPLITACRSLTKIDLTCCFDLSEHLLLSIARSCSALQSLKLESCPMVNDGSLRVVFENCPLLEELNVTECNLSGAGQYFSMSLSSNLDLSLPGLASIGNCTFLQILKMAFCNISDAGLSFVGVGCPRLVELDLYRCRSIGDAGVVSIVSGCQDIRIFNLSYCSRITDLSMAAIARLTKLCQLEIRGCTLVTSDGLTQVAEGCKRLVELDIKRCSRIDDAGLVALESRCPHLRQINVSYCPLTNNGMEALTKLGCIQNMKLVHLKNVSMKCFGDTLLDCGSLKKVKLLSHVKQALSPGVVEQLELRGCRLRCMIKPD